MATHNELYVAIKQVALHHPKSYEVSKVLHTHIYLYLCVRSYYNIQYNFSPFVVATCFMK